MRGLCVCGTTDWQLPKPRIPPRVSAVGGDDAIASRSTSGSSSSSATTMNSPSDYRRRSLIEGGGAGAGAQHQQHHHHVAPRPVRRLSDSFTEDPHAGRFERDFEEIEEFGSGEFGRVIKVRETKTGEVYAVKKSKRFEGVKHRYVALSFLSLCAQYVFLLLPALGVASPLACSLARLTRLVCAAQYSRTGSFFRGCYVTGC